MADLVLLVDDDESALLVRRLVLEGASYLVLSATDTSQALQLFATQPINVVITDHFVTGFGNGLAAEFRRLRPKLPVITLSGGSIPADESEPPDYFLHKLDGPNEMLAKIRSAIFLASHA